MKRFRSAIRNIWPPKPLLTVSIVGTLIILGGLSFLIINHYTSIASISTSHDAAYRAGGVVATLSTRTATPATSTDAQSGLTASTAKTTKVTSNSQTSSGANSQQQYYQQQADEAGAAAAAIYKCIGVNNSAYSSYKFTMSAGVADETSRTNAARADASLLLNMREAVIGFAFTRYNNTITQAYNVYLSAFTGTNCKPNSGPPALFSVSDAQQGDMLSYPSLASYPSS